MTQIKWTFLKSYVNPLVVNTVDYFSMKTPSFHLLHPSHLILTCVTFFLILFCWNLSLKAAEVDVTCKNVTEARGRIFLFNSTHRFAHFEPESLVDFKRSGLSFIILPRCFSFRTRGLPTLFPLMSLVSDTYLQIFVKCLQKQAPACTHTRMHAHTHTHTHTHTDCYCCYFL